MADNVYQLNIKLGNGETKRLQFTAPQGKRGADGKTPVKGADYWTPSDKAEIVEELTKQTAPVSYKPQTLTEEEKAQARANTGAACEPIISTTDITAGSAAPNGRPYHVIE